MYKRQFVGFAPDPTEKAYNAPPDPLVVFRGPTFRERREEEGMGERRREKRGGEGGDPHYPLPWGP